MRIRITVVAIAALLGGCSGADILARNFTPVREVCPDGVVFFASANQVPGKYREVALLSIQRVLGREEARRVGAMYRQHAGELGANAIIMTSGLDAGAGAKVLGPAIGDPSLRHGMAVAIDVPADSIRVREVCDPAPESAPESVSRPVTSSTSAGSRELPFVPVEFSRARGRRMAAVRLASARERPFDLSGRDMRTVAAQSTQALDGWAFLRNQDVRSALINLQRLKIVTGAEEVVPGVVRLSIGTLAPPAQMEYHIGYLQGSYQAALPYGASAVVELWQNGSKVGEYTREGLVLTGSP